jgi:hypothetical protein
VNALNSARPGSWLSDGRSRRPAAVIDTIRWQDASVATSQRTRSTHLRRQPFLVTIRQLPLVGCSLCHRTLAHQPNQTTTALTTHYQREHPEALKP